MSVDQFLSSLQSCVSLIGEPRDKCGDRAFILAIPFYQNILSERYFGQNCCFYIQTSGWLAVGQCGHPPGICVRWSPVTPMEGLQERHPFLQILTIKMLFMTGCNTSMADRDSPGSDNLSHAAQKFPWHVEIHEMARGYCLQDTRSTRIGPRDSFWMILSLLSPLWSDTLRRWSMGPAVWSNWRQYERGASSQAQ